MYVKKHTSLHSSKYGGPQVALAPPLQPPVKEYLVLPFPHPPFPVYYEVSGIERPIFLVKKTSWLGDTRAEKNICFYLPESHFKLNSTEN